MAESRNVGLRTVAETTEQFANNFLKVVAKEKPGNLITSSLSAQVVLAMASYGASGRTATQMQSALYIPSDKEFGLSGYQSLIETLNAQKGVELSLANRIYTSIQFPVKSAYIELTAAKFLSSSQELDFNNAQVAAKTINTWCEQQTNSRIKDVISPDSLDSDTVLVLVNAVYFKGYWDKPFNPSLTNDLPFFTEMKTRNNVPTMFIKTKLRFADVSELNAKFIEIPYQGGELSMIIILPNKIDGLKTVLDNLHKFNLSQSLQQTYGREVELYLPKFKVESTLDLQVPLEKLGMTEMFKPSATFAGIADIPMKVSKVVQKAFIEVNEEGSEAAAVTVLEVCTLSLLDYVPPLTFRVDRPFYYVIYHKSLKIPLFTGVVHRPSLV